VNRSTNINTRFIVVFFLSLYFLSAAPVWSDIEIRKRVERPGELQILLPYSREKRAVRLELSLFAGTCVSAIASWNPGDRNLSARILSRVKNDRELSNIYGQSPIAMGAAVDSDGLHEIVLEDARGGDTVLLTIQISWSEALKETAREIRNVREEAERIFYSSDTTQQNHLNRIEWISWPEGGTISRNELFGKGLTIRFEHELSALQFSQGIRLEIGLTGTQHGLTRYEEVLFTLKQSGKELSLKPSTTLFVPKNVPLRIYIDSELIRDFERAGLDLEGSGFKLPSGDGRAGGIFRSQFFLKN